MPKTIEENFIDWESHVFGFGYGTGEPYTISALRTFLETVPAEGGYDYQRLEVTLQAPVAWLLINILCHADIIEYGTSPRYGWLTNEGKALKAFIESRTMDELVELLHTGRSEDYPICYPDACNCGPHGYEEGRKCQNPFWVCR